jgi:electron transfer flavoprotein beta subunit
MHIAVLIKVVPDTWGDRRIDPITMRVQRNGDSVLDEINEKALEAALLIKDVDAGCEVIVVTMGPANAVDGIRKALGMGADRAIHICDDELVGSDAIQTSAALAAALAPLNVDLVVAGSESTDGRTGTIPAMLAERLGFAQLTVLRTLRVDGREVSGERATASGDVTIHAMLPAVVSVTEQIADARFPNFKGILAAKKKPTTVLGRADLGIEAHELGGNHSWSVVHTVTQRPARAAGRIIKDDGTAAVAIANLLADANAI